MQDKIFLGNLSSKRDWGHAKDYIKAMYLILQQEKPEDYVIATGITTTIRDMVRLTCSKVGLEVDFRGEGSDEKGFIVGVDQKLFTENVGEKYLEDILKRTGSEKAGQFLEVDPKYFRPTEVDLLVGDATKAREKLGWIPRYDLDGLITDMMKSDIRLMQKDAFLKEAGYDTLNYFE